MENTFNMEYYKTKYEELVNRLKTEKETAPIIASLMSPEAHPTDTRKAEPAKTEQESPPPANNKESLVKYTKATALTDGDNNKKNIEPHPHRLHDKVQTKFSEIESRPTVVKKEDVQEQCIRMVASAAAVTAEDTAPANILAETQKKEHLVERINGARSASESDKKETSTKSDLNDERTEEAAMVVKENMLTLTNSMRVEKVKQDYYDTKVIEETPGTVEQVTDNIEETSQDMIIKEETAQEPTVSNPDETKDTNSAEAIANEESAEVNNP